MTAEKPVIAVLGASGLIGGAVTSGLKNNGFPVVPIARHFTEAQKASIGDAALETSIVSLNTSELAHVITESKAEIVINCIGVLQDGGRGTTDEVHRNFVDRLVETLERQSVPGLLLHVSIPGRADEDRTAFSRTKRQAEQVIVASSIPYVILRPGFVVAPAAYGGSALIRSLAAWPINLPKSLANVDFAVTAATDIVKTIAFIAMRWQEGDRKWNAVWDVMERHASTVGDVLEAFRQHIDGPAKRLTLPSWLIALGAKTGDYIARLGWAPPIRSTAIVEMHRGVNGDPEAWMTATGITPNSLGSALRAIPTTIQDRWFARLYLLKPLVLGSLSLFWSLSGLIALTVAFDAATSILTSHGFSLRLAQAVTISSSLMDIGVGLAIAHRKTCYAGLLIGIGVSLFYMAGAAVITPEMWIEPLGALVKTAPAIVLMLIGLAILADR